MSSSETAKIQVGDARILDVLEEDKMRGSRREGTLKSAQFDGQNCVVTLDKGGLIFTSSLFLHGEKAQETACQTLQDAIGGEAEASVLSFSNTIFNIEVKTQTPTPAAD